MKKNSFAQHLSALVNPHLTYTMQTISLTLTSAPLFSSISLLKKTQRQGKYKSELEVLEKEKNIVSASPGSASFSNDPAHLTSGEVQQHNFILHHLKTWAMIAYYNVGWVVAEKKMKSTPPCLSLPTCCPSPPRRASRGLAPVCLSAQRTSGTRSATHSSP